MKRNWKHHAGYYLRVMVFIGILLFADLFFADSVNAAAGYADLSSMANGHEVTSGYMVDGDYKFVPTVSDQTQIRFVGEWDNLYCRNSEADVRYISRYYPYADTTNWTNTRSAVLTNDKKGKLYVELKNVGEYGRGNGEPACYADGLGELYQSSISRLCQRLHYDGRRYPASADQYYLCAKYFGKIFYYNDQGQPISLKGHYTLNDLDYSQGFRIMESGGEIYYTKEAAARMGYDADTRIIWADGSDTQPNQEQGWITYTFEGSETNMQFYVDVINPKSKDYPYRKWDVSKWENLPSAVKGYLHKYYKGASRTDVTEEYYTAWVSSEFGYTAERLYNSKKGKCYRGKTGQSDAGGIGRSSVYLFRMDGERVAKRRQSELGQCGKGLSFVWSEVFR